MMITQENIRMVEDNISIRLNPYIYAFSTNTIPNYLKIGDTLRGVDTRIAEWQNILAEKLYPQIVNLTEEYRHNALLSDEVYFRDYSVHAFLESIGKHRIENPEIRKLYSQEFFADTDANDVKAAIQSIIDDFNSGELAKRYNYYSVKENKSATLHGANDKDWKLRPNQKAVVENFLSKSDQTELLMYAVMRFGKSFTAMYCARAAKARKVLIVSAKADVAGEWQKTVETPICFKGYKFLVDTDLARGIQIEDILAESENNRVAVFLTLQNLTGKSSDGKNIKKRLDQIFDTTFDVIIVDETHYGAWANSYGAPLQDADEDIIKSERKDYENFGELVAKLHGKQKLHLSGTPYNLLYDSKFTNENIIATCQFKDILRDKQQWNIDHFDDIENGIINESTGKPYQEFDNPYFGFPQMLRFAFSLPKNTRVKLEKAKYNWTLNDLFETTVQNGTAKFVLEQDVLDLLKAVDGAKQSDGILSFLDIPKIKDNDVCKHIVFVLPRKYACDAMENLLLTHAEEFNNLGLYDVLNITGHNLKPELDNVDKVKARITELEKNGKKSITLTVYKMLTGVTVKEWDTMFMLKNTHSAQEYDQAAFRIQNQYVEEYVAPNGDIIKLDKKPQTILVDFDPIRMFSLQGLSTRIVENVQNNGDSLDTAVAEELYFFPIITYNADKLVKVEPNDLIKLITQYNNNKSIMDSVQSVMLDKGLLSEAAILQYISSQSPTSAKNSLDAPAHNGNDESDIQEPQDGDSVNNGNTDNGTNNQADDNTTADKDLEKKYRMCIARLSFYAFLTKSNIDDLQDIINSLQKDSEFYEENKRIFNSLQLNYSFVVGLKTHLSRFFALNVDDALKRANLLSKDVDLSPEERALNAIKNFNRFSDSEIVTPNNICADMVSRIGKETLVSILRQGDKILDIASKTGEFAFALYNLLKESVDVETLRNGIYSIPTSGTAYEFTRRIYEVLKLNIDNIANPQNFTAYDLLNVTAIVKKKEVIDYSKIKLLLTQNKDFSTITLKDSVIEGAKNMINFSAVVGNPPYQEQAIGSNKNFAPPIYDKFLDIAYAISSIAILIHPAKFLFNAGRTSKEWNQKMLSDVHFSVLEYFSDVKKVFPNITFTGGVAISYRNANMNFGKIGFYSATQELNNIKNKVWLCNAELTLANVIYTQCRFDLDVLFSINPHYKSIIGSDGKDKRFRNNAFEKLDIFTESPKDDEDVKVIGIIKNRREWRYIQRRYIDKNHENLFKWKVLVPRANGSGAIGETVPTPLIGIPLLAEPQIAYTQSFIGIGAFDSKFEAEALLKYIKTKFARTMLGMLKITQDNDREMWRLVPLQDFTENSDINWSKSIPEIDTQLYAKYNLDKSEIAFIESMIKPME